MNSERLHEIRDRAKARAEDVETVAQARVELELVAEIERLRGLVEVPAEGPVPFHLAQFEDDREVTLHDGRVVKLDGDRRLEVWRVKDEDGYSVRIFRPTKDGRMSKLQFGLRVDATRALVHLLCVADEPAIEDLTASATWPIVAWFAGEMEKQLALPKNRAKGDAEAWRKDHPYALLNRLAQEKCELNDALDELTRNREQPRSERLLQIIREAAEVANVAMMIADQAQQALLSCEGAKEAKP